MELGLIIILIVVSFILAFLIETLVEYLLGTPMDHIPALTTWKWTLMYVAATAGIVLCLYWKIDLIAVAANYMAKLTGFGLVWNITIVGQVLSGFIIGRGSNYLHDFLARALQKPELPGAPP